MPFCSECGTGPQTGRFCAECGAQLEISVSATAPPANISNAKQHSSQQTEKPTVHAHNTSNSYLPASLGRGQNVDSGLAAAAGLRMGPTGTQTNVTSYGTGLVGACRGCGSPVSSQNIQALGGVWHATCFKCGQCGEEFAKTGNRRVLEKDGKPYCENCYDLNWGEMCAACGKPTGTGGTIKALGQTWHPDCFRCTNCNTKFTSPGVYNKGGKPYCKNCA